MDAARRGAATPRGAARLLAGLRPWLLGVALAMPWMPAAFAQDSRDIAVAVHREGEEVVVDVDFLVAATPQEAWNVLTDYDHMSQFVADLTSSRILRRDGDRLEVAQQGRFRFGFFELKIENVRAIELVPMREIRSQLVSGDMKASAFTTRVAAEGNAHADHQPRPLHARSLDSAGHRPRRHAGPDAQAVCRDPRGNPASQGGGRRKARLAPHAVAGVPRASCRAPPRSEQVVQREPDADGRLPPVVVDQALAVAGEELHVALSGPKSGGVLKSNSASPCPVLALQRPVAVNA